MFEKILTWLQWLPVVGFLFAMWHSYLNYDYNVVVIQQIDPRYGITALHCIYQVITWVVVIFIYTFWKGGNL